MDRLPAAQGLPRGATNISLPVNVLELAREFEVNISRAAEQGVIRAVAEQRAIAWQSENQAAVASSNQYVDAHGLPLAGYRGFCWRDSISTKILPGQAICLISTQI